MSQSDPCALVRIAIAVAALTHKPSDQSTASYLLDLHSRFPLATEENSVRDWRTYALELEKQIATLKNQRDADQGLPSKRPLDTSPPKKKSKKNPPKDPHDPDWTWDRNRASWSRILSSQYPLSPSLLAAYDSLKGILASPNADWYASRLVDAILRTLDTIHAFLFSAPNPSPDSHIQTVVDSARIAMVSPLLVCLLRTAFPALLDTTQGDNTKSKRQRQRVHPAGDAHVHVDRVLDRLLKCVLLPLVRALAPLCFARLAPLVTPPSKKPVRPAAKGKNKDSEKDGPAHTSAHTPKPTDTRTDAFALIGTSLEALDALPRPVRQPSQGGYNTSSIAVGIRDRLGLEVIRELESVYASLPPKSTSELSPSTSASQQPPIAPPEASQLPPPTQTQLQTQQRAELESRAKRLERLAGTREERVRALATRDAGWILASTLNLCVTHPGDLSHGEAGPGRQEGLLREALLDRIGKLVRSVPLVCVSDDAHQGDGAQHGDNMNIRCGCVPTNASKSVIDPVCQNMLLAICERAVTQLVPL